MAGLEVSVFADMLVFGNAKGEDQIGAALLRMTQDDASTDAALEKRRQMGLFVATMVRLHVDQNIQSERKPTNRLCMSVDVQHGEVFVAPNSMKHEHKPACLLVEASLQTATPLKNWLKLRPSCKQCSQRLCKPDRLSR